MQSMLYRPGKCIGMIHSDTINILKVMDVDMVRTSAPCEYVYIYRKCVTFRYICLCAIVAR